MISILPTAAPAADAANPAFPVAAADAADAPLGIDGRPIPFSLLLGLALDAGPATGEDATVTGEAPATDGAELPPAAPDAVALLLSGGMPAVTLAAPPAAASPDASATAKVAPAAIDTAAARNPSPSPDALPAGDPPAAVVRAVPAASRDTTPETAAIPPVVVPVKTDLAGAPDAPGAPSIAPAAASTNTVDAGAYQARVATPVHAPEFPREFAAQVQVVVQRGIEQASIAVNPPELGPVEMRLEISNGEARVHFAAESAATRDALSDAMPKLRELLGSQGLALSGSTVGAELPQREQPGSPRQGGSANDQPGQPQAGDAPATDAARTTLRLVDVFA